MIKISKRLLTIASLINKKDNVIDIGCDHGYLSIYLKEKLNLKNILATDIKQSALNSAISNIAKYNLQNQIKIALSNGLCDIDTSNYNCLIIAGMGTSTILNILKDQSKLKSITKIIIQSNNDLAKLREQMSINGYMITNEKVIIEQQKYYVIIEFKKGKIKYKKEDLIYGPILKKNPENKSYFEYLLKKQMAILNNIPENKSEIKNNLQEQIEIIKKILNFN